MTVWSDIDVVTNLHPGLAHGWHPVAMSGELDSSPMMVRLLGDYWEIRRGREGHPVVLGPGVAFGCTDHAGLVWLAPKEPVARLLPVPEASDSRFRSGWLRAQRVSTAAGLLADNFLDIAHFPFVHTGTFGDPDDVLVPSYDISNRDGGFAVDYEHLYRNTEDPGVAAGIRPLIQRRRVHYEYRAPFQLSLRLDHVETGGTTMITFFTQPENLHCTRIFCQVLRDDVADQKGIEDAVAYEQAVLDEDLRLSAGFTLDGLPVERHHEMHIRADAAGLELRRILRAMCS